MRNFLFLLILFVPLLGFSQTPEENRFEKVVLAQNLNEPMELAVLPNEDVLFIERHGAVKLFNNTTKKTSIIATIPVSTTYRSTEGVESEAEDGLLGLNIDPNFSKNHWIYLYYSPAGAEAKNILARYTFINNTLDISSKKVILEIPTQRTDCCHTGGSIDWDAAGNLYLSTGDNTSPRASDGYSPIDERAGRSAFDAQKSSSNTNDLRGKILRIHPEADGTYTIPEGNLFPKNTPKTRPEIYTMGHRNPFRISVDKKTGFVYWGDVGPDAGTDSTGLGPAAEDEFGQARKSGNFGWPYFVGDNKAFWDFDFESRKSGNKFNPEKPINNSPNNTGLQEIPPAQKAFIWYPASESKQFPLLGSGGRSAMAGPVFHKADFPNATRVFPEYYENKLFIYEWMRDWIIAVTMNEKGEYSKMERFLPNLKLEHPIEMAFGPNGDLYLLEYGQGWFMANPESKLVRIEYNGGNRKPKVMASADKLAGALPLKVQFSAEGTVDFDRDSLTYEWKLINSKGAVLALLKEKNPQFVFKNVGRYKAVLTATDAKGLKNSSEIILVAGNEPPQVTLDITEGNKTFFFPNKKISYKVNVTDKEDGSLADKRIVPSNVKFMANYQDSEDNSQEPKGHQFSASTFTAGKNLIAASDCKACHFEDKKSVGPSFVEVSKKYKTSSTAIDVLSQKIIKGGAGVWGEVAMSAHPSVGLPEAKQMVEYILSLGEEKKAPKLLPTTGQLAFKIPSGLDLSKGVYKLTASYTDKGANGMQALSHEKTITLKNPVLALGSADAMTKGIMRYKTGTMDLPIVIAANSNLSFNNIDLKGITRLEMTIVAPVQQLNSQGGVVEVHLDSPDGPIYGISEFVQPKDDPNLFNGKSKPVPYKIPITPVNGIHSLYFVFKNEKAKGALFVPLTVTFISE
ncbi:PQQ-dependent sugar dehydrogenase [Emticicia sp. SJ17W-69]|uniref:PQQ-dependent sugar dehydrogenase n=1 Tax=Emticicia sp. SJ17W-69 TaxID=3421657 RepID=UPI003EBA3709